MVACLLAWLSYRAERGLSTRSDLTCCRDTGRHQRRTVTGTGVRTASLMSGKKHRQCWEHSRAAGASRVTLRGHSVKPGEQVPGHEVGNSGPGV